MNKFADSRAALEFLVSRIVAEARRENVQLSDVERDMLYFSETHWTLPNIAEVNEQFDAEYDQDEYEEKIARLIRNARDHARKENPVEFEDWSNAVKALNREDRYLLVMVASAGAGPSGAGNRWVAALTAALALGIVFYIGKACFLGGQQFCHAYGLCADFRPTCNLRSGP